jgi:hypothetical protein
MRAPSVEPPVSRPVGSSAIVVAGIIILGRCNWVTANPSRQKRIEEVDERAASIVVKNFCNAGTRARRSGAHPLGDVAVMDPRRVWFTR